MNPKPKKTHLNKQYKAEKIFIMPLNTLGIYYASLLIMCLGRWYTVFHMHMKAHTPKIPGRSFSKILLESLKDYQCKTNTFNPVQILFTYFINSMSVPDVYARQLGSNCFTIFYNYHLKAIQKYQREYSFVLGISRIVLDVIFMLYFGDICDVYCV